MPSSRHRRQWRSLIDGAAVPFDVSPPSSYALLHRWWLRTSVDRTNGANHSPSIGTSTYLSVRRKLFRLTLPPRSLIPFNILSNRYTSRERDSARVELRAGIPLIRLLIRLLGLTRDHRYSALNHPCGTSYFSLLFSFLCFPFVNFLRFFISQLSSVRYTLRYLTLTSLCKRSFDRTIDRSNVEINVAEIVSR